ncbi:MAG: TraB/GumN family protein [Rhizobiales bacterium]|nr:TraB/GumN family protein [Hyphomicrobiales bacterium]
MSRLCKLRSAMAAGLAVVMAMAFAGQTAIAAVCGGQSLLGKLESEDPQLYQQVADEAASTPNGEAVLWKVTGNGTAAPSYLFGTIHMTDVRVATLSDPVKQAMGTVKVLALEVLGIGDKKAQQSIFTKRRDLVLLRGGSLWRYLEPGMQNSVARDLQLVGISQIVARRLQPWVAAVALSVSPCESKRQHTDHPMQDQALAIYAKERGIEVVGLETMAEQFSVYSSMSIKEQAIFLIDVARLSDQMHDFNETMIQSYLDRKVTWYVPFINAITGRNKTAAEKEVKVNYMTALIDKRNVDLAERTEAVLKTGNAMIAIGAYRLPGEQGLVTLLRKRGFTVTAVN